MSQPEPHLQPSTPAGSEPPTPEGGPSPYVRTLSDIHRDVEFAQAYRLEFIKHTMSIAAGVFIFTVTFRKDIIGGAVPQCKTLLVSGWVAMVVSLLGGLGHIVGWDRYFITYRDFAHDPAGGEAARKTINACRRVAMWIQLLSFAIGIILITLFCARNF